MLGRRCRLDRALYLGRALLQRPVRERQLVEADAAIPRIVAAGDEIPLRRPQRPAGPHHLHAAMPVADPQPQARLPPVDGLPAPRVAAGGRRIDRLLLEPWPGGIGVAVYQSDDSGIVGWDVRADHEADALPRLDAPPVRVSDPLHGPALLSHHEESRYG